MIIFKAFIITVTLFQLTLASENVILIIADDLGIDFLKDYGMREDTVPVPNIERMIQNGILFENAYSYPSCSPARASMLSGRHSFRTGTRCMIRVSDDEDVNGINTDEFTIPHAIKDLNIKNAAFGKWHVGTSENGMYDNPNIMGFEHYAGLFGGILLNYYQYNKTINGNNYLRNKYITKDTRDNAIKWLSKNQHDQFFLWLAFYAPHHPYHKPPNDLHMYPHLPDIYPSDYNLNVLPWYFAMIQSLDTVIGQIIDSLDEDVKNRTNIIFLSDNGEYQEVTINGYFEFDRVKKSLYEGGVHVPFFVYGPRVKYPGTRTSALISSVDIFDTVLEMLGCENKRKEGYISDSISFLPIIEGKSNISNREYRFCEQDTGECLIDEIAQLNLGFTMANSKYKFWLYKNGTEKLFDIENDPFEKLDLMETMDLNLWQDIYFDLKDELFKLLSTEDGLEWRNRVFVF